MSTLLLRLCGPMQSWGTQSRFVERDTGLEPSKSGVVGLLCAALGRGRDEPVGDLAALTMGVRIDRPGVMRMDYHTAGGGAWPGMHYGVAIADGSRPRTIVSRRYYLADADFLVGLEGDDERLRLLDQALADPVWPLYLGRKAFVPSEPVRLPDMPPHGPGLRELRLAEALASYPWPKPRSQRDRIPEQLQIVLEAGADEGVDVRRDMPVSFKSDNRVFDVRYVRTEWVSRPVVTS